MSGVLVGIVRRKMRGRDPNLGARTRDPVDFAHKIRDRFDVFDQMTGDDAVKGVVRQRPRQLIQITDHVDTRIGESVDTNGIGCFFATATEIDGAYWNSLQICLLQRSGPLVWHHAAQALNCKTFRRWQRVIRMMESKAPHDVVLLSARDRQEAEPMSASHRFCILIIVATLPLTSPTTMASGTDKEQRLGERAAAFTEAFNASDVETLETLLAEHYSHTNDSDPPLDREAWLTSIAKRRADVETGAVKITDIQRSDIELRSSGDTAVGTGLYRMRGERNGEPYGIKIRYTQVWEWDGEDWYRVAFHDTHEPLED